MNNALLKLALFVVFLPLVGFGQSVRTISNEDLQLNTNYRWTADKIYLLDGLVYLKGTSQLEIEAGTVIKAKQHPSTGDLTSALIITKQARIYASGSNSKPIIFTTETDHPERDQHLPASDKGLWGGLVLLGESPITHSTRNNQSLQLETLPVHEEWAQFGGPDSSHDKGTLKYVSIRHAGASAIEGQRLAGLTLAGVGTSTKIDFVEVFATEAKGISFYGGTAQVKHAAVSFSGEEAFAWCEGFRGKGQFWFGLQDPNTTSSMAEHLGNHFDPMYISKATVYNATFIGNSQRGTAPALDFGAGSGGIYANSIFTSFGGKGIALQDGTSNNTVSHRMLLQQGQLALKRNLWWDIGGVSMVTELCEQGTSNLMERVGAYLHRSQNEMLDPRFLNQARTDLDLRPIECAAFFNVLPPNPEEDFWEKVLYKGAFAADNSYWIRDWTAISNLGLLNEELHSINTETCKMNLPARQRFVSHFMDETSSEFIQAQEELYQQGAELVKECHCGDDGARVQLWEANLAIEITNCRSGAEDSVIIDTLGWGLTSSYPVERRIQPYSQILCDAELLPNQMAHRAKIAILDSGIDFGHDQLQFFAPEIVRQDQACMGGTESYDFVNAIAQVRDLDGHGTHIAGIVTQGVPPQVSPQLLNYKVYEKGNADQSSGTAFEVICGIHQAIDEGAVVINLSLGFWTSRPSGALYRALARAEEAGVPVVISAGNEGLDISQSYPTYVVRGGEASTEGDYLYRWPASFKQYGSEDVRYPNLDNLFVVGATDPNEADLAPYSNYGIETVDVATAGTIYSTFKDGGFETLTGTSMSTAVVTRLIAIAKSYQPELSFDGIRSCLTSTQVTVPVPATQRGAIRGKLKPNTALACMGVDTLQISTVSPERITEEAPASIKYDSLMLLKNLVIQLESAEPGKIFNNVEIKVKASPSDEEGIYTFGGCAGTTYSWNTILADGSELPPGQYFVEIKVNGEIVNRSLPPFIKLNPRNRRR